MTSNEIYKTLSFEKTKLITIMFTQNNSIIVVGSAK